MDWNVINQMKHGAHKELYDLILNNNSKVLTFYSSAHISDINKNLTTNFSEEVKADLEFLSELTSNNCLYLDFKNNLNVNNIKPFDYLKELVEEPDWFSGSITDQLLSYVNDIESINPDLSSSFKNLLNSDCHLDIGPLADIFPEFRGSTYKEIIDSATSFFKGLSYTEQYSKLRKLVQSGLSINRDQIYNSINPFQQIDTALLKTGINYQNFVANIKTNLKQDDNWFNQITNTYINLDMFGFKEDKIYVKPNKSNTFKNIINDASHTAFGTICHYFVTNDKLAFEKANVTYKALGINTKICKPIDAYDCLKNLNDYSTLDKIYQRIAAEYDNEKNIRVSHDIDQNRLITIDSRVMFIYFFNKVYIPENFEKDRYLVLSTVKPTNGKFYYRIEIENLISNLDEFLNVPKDNRMSLSEDEFITIQNNHDWKRVYHGADITLTLTQVNGFIQLYISLIPCE